MLKVVKFGGTSLANINLMDKVAEMLIQEISKGYRLILVVSAMAGVTDHLVGLYNELHSSKTQDSDAEYAAIITTGEQVSAGMMSLIMQNKGIKARSLTGWQAGIVTDQIYQDADIKNLNLDLINKFFAEGYRVLVVTGFQGICENMRMSTLGRGGSDTTAVLLAGGLKARECYIYTDVEGVFTADPRIVPKAKKIPIIDYDLMISMAESGAKVLQAKSVCFAKKMSVDVYVASSFTYNVGTLVTKHSGNKGIIGVAIKSIDNALCKISLVGQLEKDSDIIKRIITTLANENIEVIKFVQNNLLLDIIVKDQYKFITIKLLHKICELE